jgi:hypothetical protein
MEYHSKSRKFQESLFGAENVEGKPISAGFCRLANVFFFSFFTAFIPQKHRPTPQLILQRQQIVPRT